MTKSRFTFGGIKSVKCACRHEVTSRWIKKSLHTTPHFTQFWWELCYETCARHWESNPRAVDYNGRDVRMLLPLAVLKQSRMFGEPFTWMRHVSSSRVPQSWREQGHVFSWSLVGSCQPLRTDRQVSTRFSPTFLFCDLEVHDYWTKLYVPNNSPLSFNDLARVGS